MNLQFNTSLAEGYKSASQIARVLTEDWLAHNMYCPICGELTIRRAEPNAPVKDFVCNNCKSQYELKSKKNDSDRFQSTVADGVYGTMIDRITSLDNPSFFFMHYNRYEVNNLIIVPKCFFTPDIIEKRNALSNNARRAGWEGCNILMQRIPATAKIPIILNGVTMPVADVISKYKRVYSLQTKSMESRGWLVDTLHLVERLEETFTLKQMYDFCDELKIKHPNNNHIKDKIRQQLQYLRDKGFVEFKGNGVYKRI
ncbi:MAG: DpnI domain-containing protein [Sodaliphilus sp.]|nr:DpnI domain-containing protein [Bacteroidales bacterium]MDY5539606.1 DpnI domain-containing protein [Sodaliphilus sp.]